MEIFSVQPKKMNIHIPTYVEDEFTKKIRQYRKSGLIWEEIKLQKFPPKTLKTFEQVFEKLKIAVCLPLFADNHLIGFLALGQKEKGAPYSIEEMRELLKLRDSLQICFMNILLKNNIQKENNLMKLAIEEKTKKLKEISRQQADFIAITAHELRTPLTIALLKLELLSKNAKMAEKLKEATGAVKKLQTLIQKFFDVQKYDLDKVVLKPIKMDIAEYMQEIYENHKPLMKEKKIKFVFENELKRPFSLEIDGFQMQQVFHNLLSNAMRFAPEKKGVIKIGLKRAVKSVVICVSNNGPKISKKKQEHIFEKFKDENQRFTGEGIGLGLYIARKIIDLHKGKIWVEDSEALGGAKFCVQLFRK